jgi:hypothetical protein
MSRHVTQEGESATMPWMSRKGAMATRVGLLFVLATCWSATTAAAEDAPYAEYRFLRRIGQIQITTGFLERTADLASRLASLERTGIVVLETNAGRTFSRTERVGVHRVRHDDRHRAAPRPRRGWSELER